MCLRKAGITMLKLKYLFENFELARKCLELYEYDKESIDEMLSYFRISCNETCAYEKRRACQTDQYGMGNFQRLHLQEYATLLYVMSEPVAEKPDWMNGLTDKLNFKLRQLEKSLKGN